MIQQVSPGPGVIDHGIDNLTSSINLTLLAHNYNESRDSQLRPITTKSKKPLRNDVLNITP